MDSLHTQFSRFHVFKKFKDLISSWWNIDIFLVEKTAKSYSLSRDLQLKNQAVEKLFSSQLFKDYFVRSVEEQLISANNPKKASIISFPWKQAGLEVWAVPLFLGEQAEGYIVATGFVSPEKRQTLKQALSYVGLPPEQVEASAQQLKNLSPSDADYVKKFLSILAEESFALIKERERQTQIISQIKDNQSFTQYETLIGKSAPMQFLYNVLDKIKSYESPILIQGERGTGKKYLAKLIHAQSLRKEQPFVHYNCSSLDSQFLESEFFGHAKGSFRGASFDKKGLFEEAEGGSLFLNEIGSLSLGLQTKLLRALQTSTFFPLGDTKEKKINVRILTSSSKNLEEMVEEGQFNKHLYYQLNVINIKLPPLRERQEDIPLLIEHILKEKDLVGSRSFSQKAMDYLYHYSWPNNIRELEMELEKILHSAQKRETITEEDISSHIKTGKSFIDSPHMFELGKQDLKSFIRDIEKTILIDALKKEQGNKTKVSKLLQLSRTSVISKIKEYKLEKLVNQD